jgi:thioredoxin-like negative regulator of GroEL
MTKVKLMYFSAPWCGPCRTFGPLVESIVEGFSENPNFEFIKVDADASPAQVQVYDIKSIPSLLYIKGDKPVHKTIGARPQKEVESKIKELLGSN